MSREEWNHIIDTEDGQKIALTLVEQVLDDVSKVIFKKTIQHQLIPYTLDYWRFLEKDDGDWGIETWGLDSEPDSVQPDSWARGILKVEKCIPKVEKENVPMATNKQLKASTTELQVSKVKVAIKNTVVKRMEKTKEIIEPVKKLSSDQIIKLENRKLLDRIHHMEKDGSFANYTFDHDGKIVLLRKSAPIKAFNPQVTVNVVDEKDQKKINAPSRKDKKVIQEQKSQDLIIASNESLGFIPDDSLEIPILADVIKVVPGVVFKEGSSVKVGGVFIPKVEEILEPHPPKDAPVTQNDEVLTKILEKARPFVKS